MESVCNLPYSLRSSGAILQNNKLNAGLQQSSCASVSSAPKRKKSTDSNCFNEKFTEKSILSCAGTGVSEYLKLQEIATRRMIAALAPRKVDETSRKEEAYNFLQNRKELFKLIKLSLYALRDKGGCSCQDIVLNMCKYYGKDDSPMLRQTTHKLLSEFVEKGRIKQLKRGLYCLPKYEIFYWKLCRSAPCNSPTFQKRNAIVLAGCSSNFAGTHFSSCLAEVPQNSVASKCSSAISSLFPGLYACSMSPWQQHLASTFSEAGLEAGFLTLSKAVFQPERSILYIRGGHLFDERHEEHLQNSCRKACTAFSVFKTRLSQSQNSRTKSRKMLSNIGKIFLKLDAKGSLQVQDNDMRGSNLSYRKKKQTMDVIDVARKNANVQETPGREKGKRIRKCDIMHNVEGEASTAKQRPIKGRNACENKKRMKVCKASGKRMTSNRQPMGVKSSVMLANSTTQGDVSAACNSSSRYELLVKKRLQSVKRNKDLEKNAFGDFLTAPSKAVTLNECLSPVCLHMVEGEVGEYEYMLSPVSSSASDISIWRSDQSMYRGHHRPNLRIKDYGSGLSTATEVELSVKLSKMNGRKKMHRVKKQ